MQTTQTVWYWLIEHWFDIVFAIGLAVLVDLLRVSSRIREGWRWVKDKYAESSIAALNRRIAEQEKYRDTLQTYLASDKAVYLAMLRSIVGILLFMCVAGITVIIGRLRFFAAFPGMEVIALGALTLAVGAGVSTMQLGSLDTSKTSELIRKLDAEILALKETRNTLQKPKPGSVIN
jgi:hypothetical protein